MAQRAPGAPVYWIGHSLGGQMFALVPNRDRIAKAITVATGGGYWRENVASLKPRAWYLWFIVVPLALRRPQDIGAQRIGRFGFFRASFEETLWRPHLLPELSPS